MEERPPGRAPGYTHSKKTRQKMSKSHQNSTQSLETREKISDSMVGRNKAKEHLENIIAYFADRQPLNLDRLCVDRLAELKANYPDQAQFFEENEASLLVALRDVRSDKEIDDIKKYIETDDIGRYAGSLSYQYSSSSFYAQEDATISLIDTLAYLRKFH